MHIACLKFLALKQNRQDCEFIIPLTNEQSEQFCVFQASKQRTSRKASKPLIRNWHSPIASQPNTASLCFTLPEYATYLESLTIPEDSTKCESVQLELPAIFDEFPKTTLPV